jgi:RNA polymerase sigma-70 factor (ECF subfamily)
MNCYVPLLEKVRHGDVEAFEAIFDEYHLRICRYLCSLVGDLDLAEDLAQQTFVKAYRALTRASPPDNLKAWLYTIATNTAISALRRRRLIQWLPLGANAAAKAPGHEARLGERQILQQALDRLPRGDAACLLLRFQHGLSYAELADILGSSIPAARMRLCRARAAFREIYLQLDQEVSR